MTRKTRLFLAPLLQTEPIAGIVLLWRGESASVGNTLYNDRLPGDFAFTTFEFISDVSHADYILVPHGVKKEPDAAMQSYLDSVRALAENARKPIIVFVGGDLSHNIFIDDMIVLKGSQYRYLLRDNEIIVPPFVEDLGVTPQVRAYAEKPTVAFCGWAGFPSIKSRLKYQVLNALCDMRALLGDTHARAHKKGLWFRRRALRALAHDTRMDTRFIVRQSFSGNKKTISLPPERARAEYLENMNASDFVLSPKGEGNFSVRFFEALAMGRIPVLIDTENCLPLEDTVPYDKLIVRVPWQETENAGDYIVARWRELQQGTYEKLQEEVRDVYRRYLRYDAFFNYLFSAVLTPERATREREA